jgi:hypothetical protein
MHSRLWRGVFTACVLILAGADAALAQDAAQEPARTHIGPVILTPSIELRDAGIDTNVYNDNSDEPTKDFAFTLVPAVRALLRSRRWYVDARSTTSVLYYVHQSSERSANEDLASTAELRLNRITAIAEGGYLNTRERVSSEIDERARRYEWRAAGGLNLAVTPKFSARLRTDYSVTQFNPDATFDDSELAEVLNRETRTFQGSIKYVLTPITAAVVSTEVSRVRFGLSPIRDTNIRQTLTGFDFNPRARIAGTVRIGYQVFAPIDPEIVHFSGFVGTTSVSYRVRRYTTLGLDYERRTDFSYQRLEPYYVRQSFGVTVKQSLMRQWSIETAIYRATHQYRPLDVVGQAPIAGHDERIVNGVVGLAHDIGPRLRVQTALAFQVRSADIVTRRYAGMRIGTSIAYQF